MHLVTANEATATQRRVYFHLVDATDGITPETGEAAGQPQISTNGGAWTNTGIGTLTAIGNGRYYADLTQAAVLTAGDVIETRFKSANTAETPGTSVHVVAFDPHDVVRLGLTALPNAAAGVSGGLGVIDASLNARADVRAWRGTGVPVENTAGYPIVTVKDGAGVGEIDTAAGRVAVTEAQIDQIVSELGATLDSTETLVNAVWDEVLAGHPTEGTAGKELADAGAGGGGGPTAGAIADAVWDELKADHAVANSFGDFLDIEVSSRASTAGGGGLDAAQTAAAVWDAQRATYNAANSFGESVRVNAAGLATDAVTEIQTGLATAAALATVDDFVDTEVAQILAAVDTEVAAIKAKTDLIPADPAEAADIPTAAENANALLDLAAGVETGLTVRQALRLLIGAEGGKLAGAATTTVTIRNFGDTKNRITATVDDDGNRLAMVYDLS